MFRSLAILFGFILVFSAASLAQSPVEGRWRVVSLKVENRRVELPPKEVTLNVSEGAIGGNGGCNTYGGSFEVKGNKVWFREIFSTKMFCDDSSAFESMYFNALEKVTAFRVRGGRLILSDSKRRTVIELSE